MRRELIGALFAILGLTLWAATAPAAAPAGVVLALDGSSTAHGHALQRGEAVQVGDMVDVSAGGHVKLRMIDGSVISLAPGSSMTLTRYQVVGALRDARLLLAQGVLRVVVTPVGGPSTFEVTTQVGTASVRSNAADWFVRAQSGSGQVGVLTGTVAFTSAATRRSVSIPAHWGARLEVGLQPVPPRVWGKMDFSPVIRLTDCCQSAQPKALGR